MLHSFRYLLFPLAFLHWVIIRMRNLLYDKQIISSSTFNFPLICVGNLALGGTGKSPMVEEIIRILKSDYHMAVLSRGYMRKTKGVVFATSGSTDIEIGDEPMQIYRKFPEVIIAVAEERMVGIPQILHQHPDTKVIVLDDAFQHRKVKAGLNILLTDYSNLFTRDYLFPCGDLRDVRISSERAQVVVVTKCPVSLSVNDQNRIEAEIRNNDNQQVYFTSLRYDKPIHLFSDEEIELREDLHVLLVTGIASPEPLKRYLTEKVYTYDMLRYRDHHLFSIEDIQDIISSYESIKHSKKIIITTEKDAVRLYKFRKEIEGLPLYMLPIRHEFLNDRYSDFKQNLIEFVNQYRYPVSEHTSASDKLD